MDAMGRGGLSRERRRGLVSACMNQVSGTGLREDSGMVTYAPVIKRCFMGVSRKIVNL